MCPPNSKGALGPGGESAIRLERELLQYKGADRAQAVLELRPSDRTISDEKNGAIMIYDNYVPIASNQQNYMKMVLDSLTSLTVIFPAYPVNTFEFLCQQASREGKKFKERPCGQKMQLHFLG